MKIVKCVGWRLVTGAAICLGAVWLSGCAGAPTKIERALFTIETNQVPVVKMEPVVTQVLQTNAAGSVVTSWETNRVWVTNWVEGYQYTPNANGKAGSAVVGRAVGLLGPYGELASMLAGGVLGIWGWLRSSRANRTAGVLAQVIETGRELLKGTPQGREFDSAWTKWMITHQAEEGVIEDVMGLLAKVVDNESAQVVAGRLLGMLQERSGGGSKGDVERGSVGA